MKISQYWYAQLITPLSGEPPLLLGAVPEAARDAARQDALLSAGVEVL